MESSMMAFMADGSWISPVLMRVVWICWSSFMVLQSLGREIMLDCLRDDDGFGFVGLVGRRKERGCVGLAIAIFLSFGFWIGWKSF